MNGINRTDRPVTARSALVRCGARRMWRAAAQGAVVLARRFARPAVLLALSDFGCTLIPAHVRPERDA